MKMPVDKTRIIVWVAAMLFIVMFAFFGPSSIVQNRNMNKVYNLSKIVASHECFKNIKVSASTANLGRNFVLRGTVKKQDELIELKNFVEDNISPQFHALYYVELEGVSKPQ